MGRIDYFLPGEDEPGLGANFLEPFSPRIARGYLAACAPSHGRLLDPFCQSPTLAQEAADREVLLSHFSPLHVLIVQGLLNLPSPQELDAATTRLGDTPKLGIPLREHIRSLYSAQCQRCRSGVVAERFLWEAGLLKLKEYSCDTCGFQGVAPVEELDQEKVLATEPQGFHYHYLLERITPPGDEDRRLVRNLLQLYTPRNLSALVDLSLKIEPLFEDPHLRQSMQTILLLTMASTSKFGGDPWPRFSTARMRPPLTFQERNLWNAFEDNYLAIRQMAAEKPPQVEARVTQESTRSLARNLPNGSLQLILTVPPLPDRNHWALLYFWTGWILGRDAASILKPLLRVRAGDWDWYRRAMTTALRSLAPTLAPVGQMVLLLQNGNYPWAVSLLLAAAEAGLKTEDFLHQPRLSPAQASTEVRPGSKPEPEAGGYRLTFTTAETTIVTGTTVAQRLRETALRAIDNLLRGWGEALSSTLLRLAIWEAWGQEDLLRQAIKEGIPPKQLEEELQESWKSGLEAERFSPFAGEEDLFWLGPQYNVESPPLFDRVEEAAQGLLATRAPMPLAQAQEEVYRQFPGLLTPPQGLAEAALRGYSREAEGILWPSLVDAQKESLEVLGLLQQMGERLGFQAIGPGRSEHFDLEWREGDQSLYRFIIHSTAQVANFYPGAGENQSPARVLVAIPDPFSDLLRLKLAWSPILRGRLISAGWDFIKFGLIKDMAAQEKIERHDLAKIIGLLPPVETKEAQLPLLL